MKNIEKKLKWIEEIESRINKRISTITKSNDFLVIIGVIVICFLGFIFTQGDRLVIQKQNYIKENIPQIYATFKVINIASSNSRQGRKPIGYHVEAISLEDENGNQINSNNIKQLTKFKYSSFYVFGNENYVYFSNIDKVLGRRINRQLQRGDTIMISTNPNKERYLDSEWSKVKYLDRVKKCRACDKYFKSLGK